MEPLSVPVSKIVQPQQAIRDNYAAYLTDESRLPGGTADALVFPQSEKEIVDVFQEVFAKEIPITVSAGRTGIVGGAVPFGGILLSLENLNRILGVRWNEEGQSWILRIQPGMNLEQLEEQLKRQVLPDTITVQSSQEESDVQRFFQESAGWFYPPDPTERTAHIGGTVATNASGSRSFKYGQTRRFVKGMRVVLSDGTILNLKRGEQVRKRGESFQVKCLQSDATVPVPRYPKPLVKNAAGYYTDDSVDLLDLFIGSEGTLGVITELELELWKKPECFFGGVAFFFSEANALHFVQMARTHPKFKPSVLEYFDAYALALLYEKKLSGMEHEAFPALPNGTQAAIYFEQESRAENIETIYLEYETLLSRCGTSMNTTWGAMDEIELSRITKFRHALPEAINTLIGQRQKTIPHLYKIGTDFAVSDKYLETVFHLYRSKLDPLGLEYAIFGHIGENHLHVNMLPRNEKELIVAKKVYMELAKEIVALDGTVSAEHGIGKIKKPMLNIMFHADEIQQMKNVKKALDPNWLLGKDNLF